VLYVAIVCCQLLSPPEVVATPCSQCTVWAKWYG